MAFMRIIIIFAPAPMKALAFLWPSETGFSDGCCYFLFANTAYVQNRRVRYSCLWVCNPDLWLGLSSCLSLGARFAIFCYNSLWVTSPSLTGSTGHHLAATPSWFVLFQSSNNDLNRIGLNNNASSELSKKTSDRLCDCFGNPAGDVLSEIVDQYTLYVFKNDKLGGNDIYLSYRCVQCSQCNIL